MLPGHAGNLVRNLYRRILIAGKDYPTGLDAVKKKAKAEFAKRAHLEDGLELRRAVNYGRYMVREMQGVQDLGAAVKLFEGFLRHFHEIDEQVGA